MLDILNLVEQTTGILPELQIKLYKSLSIIIIVWVITRIVQSIGLRKVEDTKVIYSWQKTSSYIAVFIILVLVGRVWFQGIQTLATFLGLISAGLALVLKDPLMNIAGWAFIIWSKPFEIGDRVKLGNEGGDVIDIGLFHFTMMETGQWINADQSTGVIMLTPNGKIFTENLRNYNSKGFKPIWSEIPVLITFESDWEKAKTVLEKISVRHSLKPDKALEESIRKAAKKLLISKATFTPKIYTSVEDNGVLLTARYLCDPLARRDTMEAIWEDILKAFAQDKDLQFAYPTRRVLSEASQTKREE